MHDFKQFLADCDRAPRLNELAHFFSSTASGRSGKPSHRPTVDRRLLPDNALIASFIRLHESRQGPFDQHYLASIPYRYEEECRLGCAIMLYASMGRNPLKLYSLGTAEGTMARTVSELSAGRIISLSCSPNIENEQNFHAYGKPDHAFFFLGPFHHLTNDVIAGKAEYSPFTDGFDIIMEDTTFQMYSPNRHDQIAFVSRHLKPEGIFVSIEKFRSNDDNDYRKRELQKNHGFKARFFSDIEIRGKEESVLRRMNENEVTVGEMSEVLSRHFRYGAITWNSGNFYTMTASNSASNLGEFINHLGQPALPREYVYEQLPMNISALDNGFVPDFTKGRK